MRQIKLLYANEQVKINNGKLFFGSIEVQDCEFIKEEEQSVAALYLIRYKNESGNWEIVTGLDLIHDQFWLGGLNTRFHENGNRVTLPCAFYKDFASIERIMNTIADRRYKEWAIFEENDFDKDWARDFESVK